MVALISRIQSVHALTLCSRKASLDVLIANAGVMATPFGHTADGFETHRHQPLGHFVLSIGPRQIRRRRLSICRPRHRLPTSTCGPTSSARLRSRARLRSIKSANILSLWPSPRHRARGTAAAVHPGGFTRAGHLIPATHRPWSNRSTSSSLPKASHPINGRPFLRGRPPPYGPPSSLRLTKSVDATARTVTSAASLPTT